MDRLLRAKIGAEGMEGRGDRLVVAAKVLVLKRLLVSSFGAGEVVDESA